MTPSMISSKTASGGLWEPPRPKLRSFLSNECDHLYKCYLSILKLKPRLMAYWPERVAYWPRGVVCHKIRHGSLFSKSNCNATNVTLFLSGWIPPSPSEVTRKPHAISPAPSASPREAREAWGLLVTSLGEGESTPREKGWHWYYIIVKKIIHFCYLQEAKCMPKCTGKLLLGSGK